MTLKGGEGRGGEEQSGMQTEGAGQLRPPRLPVRLLLAGADRTQTWACGCEAAGACSGAADAGGSATLSSGVILS